MFRFFSHGLTRPAAFIGSALLLAGCSTLPSSGPTAREVRAGVRNDNQLGFRLVDIDPVVAEELQRTATAEEAGRASLASLAAIGRTDVVGPGDVLAIGIYEVGVSLFGAGREAGSLYDPSARSETFPGIVVDQDGAIHLPYVGRLEVAGRTPAEIQAMIERGLRGKSQNPQAVVGVRESVSSTIYVAGDVRRPGRYVISLQQQHLLDAIALAGGSAFTAEDTIIRFHRGARTVEERLRLVRTGEPDDLLLLPGDRIELVRRPRTFMVMGAATKVAEVPFDTGDISLAQAVARAGGPLDTQADAAAIFLFRYLPGAAVGTAEQPVIYRLNMLKPASYFLSQRLSVRDKDVIFIANAAANRPAKLVAIINQLFSPLITARALSGK